MILHPDQLFECDWTDCCDYLQAPHTSLIKSLVNMAAVVALLTRGAIGNRRPHVPHLSPSIWPMTSSRQSQPRISRRMISLRRIWEHQDAKDRYKSSKLNDPTKATLLEKTRARSWFSLPVCPHRLGPLRCMFLLVLIDPGARSFDKWALEPAPSKRRGLYDWVGRGRSRPFWTVHVSKCRPNMLARIGADGPHQNTGARVLLHDD